jgi:hypothetical protein
MKSPNTALQTNTRPHHGACFLRSSRFPRLTPCPGRALLVRATRQAPRTRVAELGSLIYGGLYCNRKIAFLIIG